MNSPVVKVGYGPPQGSAPQGEAYYDYNTSTRYVFYGSNWATVTPIEDSDVVTSSDHDMESHVEVLRNM